MQLIDLLCVQYHLPARSMSDRVVMVKELDCDLVVSKFELQSRYYIRIQTNTFGESINPLFLPLLATG